MKREIGRRTMNFDPEHQFFVVLAHDVRDLDAALDRELLGY